MFEMHRGEEYRKLTYQVAAAESPNQLHASFTGFGTNPNDSTNAQRQQAGQFQALYPGGDFLIWAWDQDGSVFDAKRDQECADFLKVYRAGNSRGAYTSLLMDGHSFGGQFLVYLINWLATNAADVKVDLARFLDPVPNPSMFGANWTVPANVSVAMQWTQRNGIGFGLQLFGPNGTPLPGVVESVAFPWEFIPSITHLSLPGDQRVWSPSLAAMQQVIK